MELYKIMAQHGVVHIRGTPASGKTTLLQLFHTYLFNSHPELMVCSLTKWRSGPTTGDPDSALPIGDYLTQQLEKRYTGRGTRPDWAGVVFLLDEAQGSYWDQELWLLLKSHSGNSHGPCFVLFTSYGSPKTKPVVFGDGSASVTFATAQRVSLRSSPNSSGSVFLFLDAEEFVDLVERYLQCAPIPFSLDSEVREYIYSLTAGHAGCLQCLLNAFQNSTVCILLVPVMACLC
jgi:hypothetical protein